MKKTMRNVVILFGSTVGVSLLVILVSAIMFSPQYMYRIIANGESKVTDHAFFPARAIAKSSNPYIYAYAIDQSLDSLDIRYESGGTNITAPLLSIVQDNATTSLVVIHKDAVKYEKYANGYTEDTINTSFSSVKSLDSLLIGMAIEDGYIRSETQCISDFITEFRGTAFGRITIKNLLMMRSNIHYKEGLAWFGDDAKTYYSPDLRALALEDMKIDPNYTGRFHYNNYHPLLLGIILERSTGQAVADYFQKKLWDKIGAEYDASWSIDSQKNQFEKMESGLNFLAIDFAKIGSMLLHKGTWNGQGILNEGWISVSTVPPGPLTKSDTDNVFLIDKEVGYQYMWYSIDNDMGGHDFFAAGKYGQYLYISPEYDVVIVRTGISTGNVDWWPDVFQQIASSFTK